MTYIDLNENKNFKPLIERKVVDAQDGTLKEKKGISEGAIYRAKKLMELQNISRSLAVLMNNRHPVKKPSPEEERNEIIRLHPRNPPKPVFERGIFPEILKTH